MRLLIIFLNNEDKLEEVMDAFLEVGIRGATLIDSHAMGKLMSDNLPLFGGLRKTADSATQKNKIIFSVIDDEVTEELLTLLDKILHYRETEENDLVFVLPVDGVYGY